VADQWFYTVGGKKAGPASLGQLQEMVQAGKLKPTDVVQREGTRSWVAAMAVEGLVPKPAKAEPPTHSAARHSAIKKRPLDPILAAVASLFLPPLGQFLIGQKIKAFVLLLIAPLVLFAFLIIAYTVGLAPEEGFLLFALFYNVSLTVDAFLLAKKIKDGSEIGTWEFFAKWSPY